MTRTALVLSAAIVATPAAVLHAQAAPERSAGQGTGTVSGTVTNRDGEPMPGARVRLANTNYTAQTNVSGRFTIVRVPAGNYTVVANYLGYTPASQQVTVQSGGAASVSLRFSPSVQTLSGVTVVGQVTEGQARALQQQQNAPNVVNAVAAEQIRRFPDRSGVEAVQRVPGVAVSREEGEAESIQIRGIGAGLNAVTINGQRVASPGGGRTPSVEAVQADLVRQITVTKALLPEQDGDAIGGSIDFRLAEAPERPLFRFDLQGGYNTPPDRVDTYGKQNRRGSVTLGRRYLGSRFGVLASGSYQQRNSNLVTPGFSYQTSTGASTDSVFTNSSFFDRDKRITRYGGTSYLDYAFAPDNRVHLAANLNQYSREQIRRGFSRSRGSYSASQQRFTTTTDAASTWNDRNEQNTWMAELGGDHRVRASQLDYSASYSSAAGSEPRTFIDFTRPNTGLASLPNAQWQSAGWEQPIAVSTPYRISRIEERFNENWEATWNMAANLRLPLPFGAGASDQNYFKFGTKVVLRDKTNDRHVTFRDTIPGVARPAVGDASFAPYAGVNFRDQRWGTLSELSTNLRPRVDTVARRTSYVDADEQITAGYGQVSLNLTRRLNTLVGVRVENTDTKLFSLSNRIRTGEPYTNVLPQAHLTYRFSPSTQLRFARTQGLGRPSFRDQSPFEDFSESSNPTINRGNPALKPQTARNLDLLLETYSSAVGTIGVGVFRKDLYGQFINTRYEDSISVNGRLYDLTTRENGTGARVDGIEFSLSQSFARLPVPRFLRPFGVIANFTYVKSEQTVGTVDSLRRTVPTTNTPPQTGNLALTYDNTRLGLAITTSANYRGPIIEQISASGGGRADVWNDKETYVGLALTQRLRGRGKFYFEANNLFDQGENSYLGDPRQGGTRRVRSRDFYGREFSTGFRFNY